MQENMGVENSVKIGFLNHSKIELLDTYQNFFDIVIIGEGDFEIGLYILFKILK